MTSNNSFNLKPVFEQQVEDSGRSLTLFINGLWTTEQEYLDQAKELSDKLRLSDNQEIIFGNETFSGSIQYQHFYNESDKTGDLVVDIGLPIVRGLSIGLLVFGLSSLGGKTSADEIIEKSSSVKWSNTNEALKFLQETAGLDADGILENGLKGLIQGISDLAILETKMIDEEKIFQDAQKVFNSVQQAITNLGGAITDVLQGNFDSAQNQLNQAEGNYNAAFNNVQNLLGNMVQQYGSAWQEYFDKYKFNDQIKKILETFAPVFDGIISGKNPLEDADFSKAIIDTVITVVTDLPIFKNVPIIKVANAVYEGVIAALPEDAKEAFSQFWFSGTKMSNDNLNEKWIESVKSDLKKPNYSLTTIGYSQGNFFFEDALKDMGENVSNKNTRVFALGSPTKYLAVGGLETFNGENDYNIKNENDPVTKLQFDNDFFIDKFKVLFDAGVTAYQEGISQHDFGKYLNNPTLKQGVNKNFQEFYPKGYYFPNEPIKAENSAIGTKDDDWLEGGESNDILSGLSRNDVLRGNGGKDVLIGGVGYDILDGGEGNEDTADYSNSESGVSVLADKILGSDVYKVSDGFGTEDILGNIEIVSGSNFADEMTGGDYSDIFYGQGGNDLFRGQGGDDKFYGGTGEDTAYGGDDNDDLRGEEGNDELRGENGNDSLYGGTG
ncbi:hypothetical protein QUB60_11690, partial [Microcoleus sp. A2-C5]|uniref:calcium-binding protein n=3 Tax=unclassified Microcoleus TaxID=2642155 RepID=UPI003B1CFCAA